MRYNDDIHIVIVINEEELPCPEKLDNGYVYAYVINVDWPDCSEFGTVKFEWNNTKKTYKRIY